jgi:WXG100 family type VII secretion target
MANINVSYEALHDAASKISSGRDQITHELDAMKGRIDSLVSSGFVTQKSSAAFQHAYQTYTTSAKSTIQGLDEVVNFLRKVEQTMQETDQALASSIRA